MTAHATTTLNRGGEIDNPLPHQSPPPISHGTLTPPTAPDWGLALGISTTDFTARAFTSDPRSLKEVRLFVQKTIHAWGLEAFIDDLILVVNELTTNAVRHALTSDDETHVNAWLGMTRTAGSVVCAVTDPSSLPPRPQPRQDLAQKGRGLLIVDALTSQWGYAHTQPAGKTVWARITAKGL
ncbi:ATP-binding protein [Actinacidiphila glaucinigra]|uniref:Histidine kinase-like ATPase domain-containing protein n=1 Tax=Actinacidiphila glaucinigra TaxID=235986 RepID=A0A239NPF0_9ACTN|nr:ATP-binding protein [Actinacidiphila glaucinigra]SNT56244.1 Histidine kinase-like ATPase domain-containing protein [Actinacidiphila glaucinigra]